MYGLSEETDLDFILGKKLTQVTIGTERLIFSFEDDLSIVVDGRLSYQITDVDLEDLPEVSAEDEEALEDLVDSEEWPDDAFTQSTRIHWLLGSEITEFEIGSLGTLFLTFSNTDQITLFDSNTDTESYQIISPTQTLTI